MELTRLPDRGYQPFRFQMMELMLNIIHQNGDHFVMILGKDPPCRCLQRDYQQISTASNANPESFIRNLRKEACLHGMTDEPLTASDRQQYQQGLIDSFNGHVPGFPRDFDSLVSFMDLDPNYDTTKTWSRYPTMLQLIIS